jgi:hypothetical protein
MLVLAALARRLLKRNAQGKGIRRSSGRDINAAESAHSHMPRHVAQQRVKLGERGALRHALAEVG